MKTKPTTTTTAGKVKNWSEGGSAKAALPLAWSAREYAPKRRWWWYVGLAVVSVWLSGLALAFQDWSLLAVVIATTLVFFVMGPSRQRNWHYELTKKELRIRGDKRQILIRLAEFRAFTVEELPTQRGQDPDGVIVLLPSGRLRPAVDVYFHQDDEKDLTILKKLGGVLPYEEALEHRHLARTLDRIARLFRLG